MAARRQQFRNKRPRPLSNGMDDVSFVDALIIALKNKEVQQSFRTAILGEEFEKVKEIVAPIVEAQVASLHNEVKELKSTCDELEQYSRRNNVRISGIDENTNEFTDNIVLELAHSMDLDLSFRDLCRSHRVGRKKPCRDIIVKFVCHNAKEAFFANKYKLKHPVYVKEDLTRERDNLYYQCRLLRKQGKLTKVSTRDGRIIVRNSEGQIRNLHSLEELQGLHETFLNRPSGSMINRDEPSQHPSLQSRPNERTKQPHQVKVQAPDHPQITFHGKPPRNLNLTEPPIPKPKSTKPKPKSGPRSRALATSDAPQSSPTPSAETTNLPPVRSTKDSRSLKQTELNFSSVAGSKHAPIFNGEPANMELVDKSGLNFTLQLPEEDAKQGPDGKSVPDVSSSDGATTQQTSQEWLDTASEGEDNTQMEVTTKVT